MESWVPVLFLLTVFGVFAVFFLGLYFSLFKKGRTRPLVKTLAVVLLLAGWCGFQWGLASSGFYQDFSGVPPRLLLIVGPFTVVLVVLAFLGKTRTWAEVLPAHWPVAAQVFRVPVEIVLWKLATAGVVSTMMTFEGQNFDVLVGASAPFVAWLMATERLPKAGIILWNVFGLAMVTNVVVRGILSTPSVLQLIHTQPPNTFIATTPYVLLPAFLVPMAYFFHLISLKRL